MKRVISIVLSLIMLLSVLATISVGAEEGSAQGYVDEASTRYVPGYVLHNMDFSKVNSFEDTGYTLTADGSPTSMEVADGALKVEGSASKTHILFTNNDIPKNMQDYTVDIKFRFAKQYDSTKSDYFVYIMSAGLDSNNKVTNLKDSNIRYNGTVDACDAIENSNWASMVTAMQSGSEVNYRFVATGRNNEYIEITCNGMTAKFVKNSNTQALADSFMGVMVGRNIAIDFYSVRVVAGTPSTYTALTWPGTENALVQTVTSAAVSESGGTADDAGKLPTNRVVPTEPTLAYEDKAATKYNAGYVLHHMDFSKVDSWEDVGYFVTNDTEPDSLTITDEGYLQVVTNPSDGVNILFTGNGIPKNIQEYTVDIKFRFVGVSTSYFSFIQSATLDEATGTTSNKVDSCLRYGTGKIDQASFTDAQAEEQAAMLEDLKAGEWVTYRYTAMERNAMYIEVSCGGHTVKYIKTDKTTATMNSFMGMLIGRNSTVEIATVTVTAGLASSFATAGQTWPGESGALVQAVNAAAIAAPSTDDPQDGSTNNGNNEDDKNNGGTNNTPSTEASTDAPTTTGDSVEESGCGSVVGGSALMLMIGFAALPMLKKTRKSK